MKNNIIVNGNSLKIKDVFEISYKNKEISFPDDKIFKEKIDANRNFLEHFRAVDQTRTATPSAAN